MGCNDVTQIQVESMAQCKWGTREMRRRIDPHTQSHPCPKSPLLICKALSSIVDLKSSSAIKSQLYDDQNTPFLPEISELVHCSHCPLHACKENINASHLVPRTHYRSPETTTDCTGIVECSVDLERKMLGFRSRACCFESHECSTY
jgi:hypothetical protein